jgi:tetratricopeptide (TPR) repeat protein
MVPIPGPIVPPETEEWLALKDVVRRFEAAWRESPRPGIDAFVPAGTPLRRRMVIELVHVDLELRLKSGEAARVEEYLARFPEIADNRAEILSLIATEHALRRRREPELTLGEYLQRFPQHSQELAQQIAQPTVVDSHAPFRPSTADLEKPPEIAGYEELTLIGRGGMGVVYRARQKRLNRFVALKMLRAGAHAGADLRARFHVEAEALAKLQHPNIVQIYEVDDCGGCPYIAMEFLDGGGLNDLLHGQSMSPHGAAELVETLARAMHAAHLRGIVHRDLKPSNILLLRSEDPRPEPGPTPSPVPGIDGFTPKVTDFGLAKHLTENKGYTATGVVVGTPSYMAPEQATGRIHDIGPPTDVYSLGAILYEVLTGQPPFEGSDGMNTLRRVVTEEPAAPSRLRPKLPRDLETICLKCLAKDAAKRYPSAEHLADDLRRFLNCEPIAARPAGPVERVVKWIRRRPVAATLVGVVAAASMLLAGSFAWSYARILHERNQKQMSLQIARKAIDDLYTKMASERLFDEPQLDPLCEELLEKALVLYADLAREHGESLDVRRDIAMAWYRLGDIHRMRDQRREAEEAYGIAIQRQEELCRDDSRDPRHEQDLANSHNWLGELLREEGRSPELTEGHYQSALNLQRELVANHADDPKYRMEMARSHYNLAIVERETGRSLEARADCDRAVELLTALHDIYPAEPNYQQDLARALVNRGVLSRQDGKPDAAKQDYDRAIDILSGLHRESPNRTAYKSELAVALQDRGNLFWSLGRQSEAQREHKEALALLRDLVGNFSGRPHYRKKKGIVLNNLGTVQAASGDRSAAEQSWVQARTVFEELTEKGPEVADYQALLGMTLGNLGWLRTDEKNWPEARLLIEQGIQRLQAALLPNPRRPEWRQELRNQYQDASWTLIQLGDHAAAARAAEGLAGVFPDRAQDSYFGACLIARCVPLTKDSRQAREYVEQSVTLLRTAVGKASPSLNRIPDEKQVFEALSTHPDFAVAITALEAKTRK